MRRTFAVKKASYSDLHRLVAFLSQSEIDQGFCKPLSDRDLSIHDRVYSKFKQGAWVIAEMDDQIVACLAVVLAGRAALFSTFACINSSECKLAGAGVWEQSLEMAREMPDVVCIEIDSWVGNAFINRFLGKRGFQQIRTFFDPAKRPANVQSVLYRMELGQAT